MLPNVVSVGNVDDTDTRYGLPAVYGAVTPCALPINPQDACGYSNYNFVAIPSGSPISIPTGDVAIGAPGVNIINVSSGGAVQLNGSFLSGTSFSAPYVAGIAALVWAKYPAFTAAQLVQQIYSTAVPIPNPAGTDTTNQGMGTGRIDPGSAMGEAQLTRMTAVGAGALQSVNVFVSTQGGASLLYSGVLNTRGQSTGCELPDHLGYACIVDVPFDLGNLGSGTYQLQLQLVVGPIPSSLFYELKLTTPGLTITNIAGNASIINAPQNTEATGSLFSFGLHSVIFTLTKTTPAAPP
jgi:hypothetical protein